MHVYKINSMQAAGWARLCWAGKGLAGFGWASLGRAELGWLNWGWFGWSGMMLFDGLVLIGLG